MLRIYSLFLCLLRFFQKKIIIWKKKLDVKIGFTSEISRSDIIKTCWYVSTWKRFTRIIELHGVKYKKAIRVIQFTFFFYLRQREKIQNRSSILNSLSKSQLIVTDYIFWSSIDCFSRYRGQKDWIINIEFLKHFYQGGERD
jgi:hypothetical protein